MSSSSRSKKGKWAPPPPSSPAAHARMKAVRREGTQAELALRQALDARGVEYSANALVLPDLRRRADIVFEARKVAVFVDGCFWHGCPIHGTTSKSNAEYWAEKIEQNKRRDRETDEKLSEAGWTVVRVWEHEDPDRAADMIMEVLGKDRR